MQIHKDENCLHSARNGLQRPSCDTCSSEEIMTAHTRYDYIGSWNQIGALCGTDYKWVQQQQVVQGKILPFIKKGTMNG